MTDTNPQAVMYYDTYAAKGNGTMMSLLVKEVRHEQVNNFIKIFKNIFFNNTHTHNKNK